MKTEETRRKWGKRNLGWLSKSKLELTKRDQRINWYTDLALKVSITLNLFITLQDWGFRLVNYFIKELFDHGRQETSSRFSSLFVFDNSSVEFSVKVLPESLAHSTCFCTSFGGHGKDLSPNMQSNAIYAPFAFLSLFFFFFLFFLPNCCVFYFQSHLILSPCALFILFCR